MPWAHLSLRGTTGVIAEHEGEPRSRTKRCACGDDGEPAMRSPASAGVSRPSRLGFASGLWADVDTANDEPRPQIRRSRSKNAKKLTAEIAASNMETDDRLAIFD